MVFSCVANRERSMRPRSVIWKYPLPPSALLVERLECDGRSWSLAGHCCSSYSATETQMFLCMAWGGVGWEFELLCCSE